MKKKIRLLGAILIVCGYIWQILWLANAIVPLPRSIFRNIDEKYPATRMYSRSEVLDAVQYTSMRWNDNSLGILIPSTLMLIGGILIHRASKEL